MLRKDEEFRRLYEKGIGTVLNSICGFDRKKHERIFREAALIEEQIAQPGQRFSDLIRE
jgi:hypothetical protein